MANWVHQTFNDGKIDQNSKKTLLAAAFALSFFTNFALFIVTGNYRSIGNVALMTTLNFAIGSATTELLKSKWMQSCFVKGWSSPFDESAA